jgi:hypothetical protein
MNELNNREQEQYAEPTTKKSSKQIVKRTLVVIGLALAVYVVYSVVICLSHPIVIFSRFIWFRKMRHLLFNHQLRLKIGRNLAEAKHGNV